MVGPNCMGVMAPGAPSAWIGTVLPSVRPGSVGTSCQSGSFGEAVGCMGPRVGVRGMVSSGNEGAGDAADWVAFYADDPKTQTIALIWRRSGVRPHSRHALRRAAEAGKPVVVSRSGRARSGRSNALAHSGAIVGSDAAFDALCRAYGVIRCADYGDWMEALEVFGAGRRPRGPRLVVITNSGGEGEHAADLAEPPGSRCSRCPATSPGASTPTGTSTASRIRSTTTPSPSSPRSCPAVARAAAEHPEIDGVLLNIDQSLRFQLYERDTSVLVTEIAGAAARARPGTFLAILSTATADAPDHVVEALRRRGMSRS